MKNFFGVSTANLPSTGSVRVSQPYDLYLADALGGPARPKFTRVAWPHGSDSLFKNLRISFFFRKTWAGSHPRTCDRTGTAGRVQAVGRRIVSARGSVARRPGRAAAKKNEIEIGGTFSMLRPPWKVRGASPRPKWTRTAFKARIDTRPPTPQERGNKWIKALRKSWAAYAPPQ